MAALIGEKDWSKTALGPADAWTPSLTLIVNIILASGFPMAVRWGPDFVMIYNDGYRPILGEKHPWALGLPFSTVWPEVQPRLRPLHEDIIAGKRGAFFAEDLLLKIQRHGAAWEDAHFTIGYSPIPDAAAPTGVGGVLITAVETTARLLMEEALRASQERFAGIFRQTSVGIVQCGLDGRFLLANNRFCEIAARSDSELMALRVVDITDPEDREADIDHLNRLMADGVPITVEKRYMRPDGSRVWINSNIALTRDSDGNPQNFIAIVQDITERRRAQKQQELLLGELNHRVTNLFAVTDSVISLSARSATTPADLARKIRGRLNALALAHELVLPEATKKFDAKGQPTSLTGLVQKILAPYVELTDGGSHNRLIINGPPTAVAPGAVTTLALVLHELATNAAKYGAFSALEGGVTITWSDRDDVLALTWQEHGGPTLPGPPASRGFGTQLSAHSIRDQLGGELSYQWNPGGLLVELSFPLQRLED